MGVHDAHFNGDCYRSAAVDSLDEHVSAAHLGIDAETLHSREIGKLPLAAQIARKVRVSSVRFMPHPKHVGTERNTAHY